MIKKILTIFSLAATIAGTAQQNLDFETWATGNPTGWTATFGFFAAGSVSQNTTDPGEALSSLKLQTSACAFCGFLSLPSVLPGLAQQSVPFTGRPISMTVLLRANIDANDEAIVVAATTVWNTGTNAQDNIGGAGAFIPGGTAMSAWQSQTFPFSYSLATTPDSLSIVLMSSDSMAGQATNQSLNSILEVDAIVFNYPAGISEVAFMGSDFIAYPNPAANEINFTTKNITAETVNVYDVTGRLVKTSKLVNGKLNLEISNLDNGLYVYSIVDKNNKSLNTSKFVVAK